MMAAAARGGRLLSEQLTMEVGSRKRMAAYRDLRTLISLYLVTMFVTAFFFKQGAHGGAATEAGAINLGSIVFAVVFCAVFGFVIVSAPRYGLSGAGMRSLGESPAFVAFAGLLLLEVLSCLHASAPVGALYQAAPGLLTLVVTVCLYTSLNTRFILSRARLSGLWHHAMVFQTSVLALLVVSGLTGSGGFGHEAGLLPIRLRGSWFVIHPDLSGMLAEVGCAHFMIRSSDRQRGWLLMVAVNLAVFALAQSRTSYAIAAITFICWYVMKGRRSFAFNAWAICFAPLAGFAVTILIGLFRRGQTDADLAGMTGRAKLWSTAFEFSLHHPLFGYGAFSGVRVDFASTFNQLFPNLEIRTLDNQFMNTMIEAGYVGVLALFLCILFCIVGALRNSRFDNSALGIELLGLSLALPVRAWLGQLFVLYDPTQMYGVFIILWISLNGQRRLSSGSERARFSTTPVRNLFPASGIKV